MPLRFAIPGRPLELDHLVLDVNGTITDRGALLDGVVESLARIGEHAGVRLLSADTFGTLTEIAASLGVEARHVAGGEEKLLFVEELGAARCAAVGNGANDALMLAAAGLGIAVVGPEGASARALSAADVVCRSAAEALELLLDERALVATLRS